MKTVKITSPWNGKKIVVAAALLALGVGGLYIAISLFLTPKTPTLEKWTLSGNDLSRLEKIEETADKFTQEKHTPQSSMNEADTVVTDSSTSTTENANDVRTTPFELESLNEIPHINDQIDSKSSLSEKAVSTETSESTQQKTSKGIPGNFIMATPRLDLGVDGVWKGLDGSVYYLRQIENQVWWVGFSVDNGQTHTTVFKGIMGLDEVLNGQMIGLPLGTHLQVEDISLELDTSSYTLQTLLQDDSSLPLHLTFAPERPHMALTDRRMLNRTPTGNPFDLSGVWWDNNSADYYVRHIGDDIWWLGLSQDGGEGFTMVFHGKQSGSFISGDWVDLPRGVRNKAGQLTLEIISVGNVVQLQKIDGASDLLAQNWERSS